jgi:hypothetical protein
LSHGLAQRARERVRNLLRDWYTGDELASHQAASSALVLRQQLRLGHASPAAPRDVSIDVDGRLPCLAWLCTTDGASYRFTVGPGVAVAPDRIFEGVWDGPFTGGELSGSEFVFGSGALLAGQVVFIPPKHTMEYLFVLHDKRRRLSFVSNSLNFCLAAARIETGSSFFQEIDRHLVERTHLATAAGVDLYDPVAAEDGQYRLLRLMFYNFSVCRDGGVRLQHLRPRSYFHDYASYRRFLGATLGRIFENGASALRKRRLLPITALSKGYDSPAVAVLAREQGCTEAVTLGVSVYGLDDCGLELGRDLGLAVSAFRHVAGDDIPDLNFAFEGDLKAKILEFVATAGIGDDVTFLAFEEALAGRILLTGALGDSVWDRDSTLPPGVPVRIKFGKSLTEFRLRVGFAHLPVPFIGVRFPAPMKTVSKSSEMRPYTLHNDYDRPVPRRIVEEAGVRREAFGRTKRATAPLATNHRALFKEAVETVMARYRQAVPPAP